MAPQSLEQLVSRLLTEFKKEPPKFIVDSRKYEFPWDRPPLPLWPMTPDGKILPPDLAMAKTFDEQYMEALKKNFGEAEALRYKAMEPLREYMMTNYKVVGMFGQQVLFERKA